MEISEEINNNFREQQYDRVIERLKQPSMWVNSKQRVWIPKNECIFISRSRQLGPECRNDSQFLFKSVVMAFNGSIGLCHNTEISPAQRQSLDELIYECARLLRNSCASGLWAENYISGAFDAGEVFAAASAALSAHVFRFEPRTLKMCWQFVANTTVLDIDGSPHFFQYCRHLMCGPNRSWQCPCESGNARACTMILYNLFRHKGVGDDTKDVIEFILGCYDLPSTIEHDKNNEFHHIFLEYLITKYGRIPYEFVSLDSAKRLNFLYYIADHMRSPSHAAIQNGLLMVICDEFKKKSDCILKTIGSYVDTIEPKEVIALLDVLAQASSDERYVHILSVDGSLFLNVGCLLQTINKIGESASCVNIFTPVQKLGQLAPNSEENTNIERDISYQLKTTLVRTLGNLAYKNTKNQALAREMDILMAVLDSTNLDARNPCKHSHKNVKINTLVNIWPLWASLFILVDTVIKEWSILAIRNLCENNAENQQLIRQLTKVGDAENSDILKELNIDMGSLRIGPNWITKNNRKWANTFLINLISNFRFPHILFECAEYEKQNSQILLVTSYSVRIPSFPNANERHLTNEQVTLRWDREKKKEEWTTETASTVEYVGTASNRQQIYFHYPLGPFIWIFEGERRPNAFQLVWWTMDA